MPRLNPLLCAVAEPPIVAAQSWAGRYDGRHGPVLDLCQAVPGYAPHPGLLERLAAAAADPASAKYGAINGDAALREAYAAEIGVEPAQVVITAGCNQAFFATLMAVASAGDNVLLPVPWFWNHQQSCQMLGIEPRPLRCDADDGFIPELAAAVIDSKTRAIVLITPNNPTGAIYPPGVIAEFYAVCQRHDIWLILDETYRDFLPDGQAHALFQDLAWPRTVIGLYSFSKAYCAPGHRIGAVSAGVETVAELLKALDCLHICPNRPAQAALAWGVDALREWRAGNRGIIGDRAQAVRSAFGALPGWQLASLGAYFAYVRHPLQGTPSALVAERLTAEFGVTCLPGSAFGPGQDDYVRFAFANTDIDGLHQLAGRLARLAA